MGERINITYETLFDMLRNEKRRDELQKLEKGFYEHLAQYIKEKEELSVSDQGSELFSHAEQQKAVKQLENIRKLVRELYERREKKIVNLALISSRTGSLIDKSALLEPEQQLFNELQGVFSKHRDSVLVHVLSARQPQIGAERAGSAPQLEAVSECKPTKLVRFLKPVPKFVGKELEVYGPFEEEDVANLPVEIADLLIKKVRVEELKS